MTKRKSPVRPARGRSLAPASDEPPTTDAPRHYLPSWAAVREAIESGAIALILAFLVRTFEAEAFVIPTGSMAPTLMGLHKDLTCPRCGCSYQASASEEVDVGGAQRWEQDFRGHLRELRIGAATCPMCRYTMTKDDGMEKEESYNGDRILVTKFAYQIAEPERWDVIVFKYPGDREPDAQGNFTDSQTNFIKRLIGLPGETVRIQHGDIWICRPGSHELHIARKEPKKLLAMLQPVFDNDYMPRIATLRIDGKDWPGWPQRWTAEPTPGGGDAGQWTPGDAATFYTNGKAAGPVWLRYRHLTPSSEQWQNVLHNPRAASREVDPQFITDFTAYDTNRLRGAPSAPSPESVGEYWVGDLALQCVAEVESATGELIFELRKGGREFQCRIDVASGAATLSISGADMRRFAPTAPTAVRGPGRHEIRFSNCDNQMLLWVDGKVAKFNALTEYDEHLGNTQPRQTDLEPVGIASKGVRVRMSHLVVLRDIYYIANPPKGPRSPDAPLSYGDSPLGVAGTLKNGSETPADFSLASHGSQSDRFFVLGDNSATSKDGRLWGPDNCWVSRELLIGKAFFIYWPHSWHEVPYVEIPFPYFPNFGRMRLVR
jgi:signal peptidase I